MPDFTVIQGGGRGSGGRDDYDANRAHHALRRLAVELLRALARGDDYGQRVTQALIDFETYASQTGKPLGGIVQEAVHAQAFDREGMHDSEDAERDVLIAALQVTAESMADDNAASGRHSRRWSTLNQAINARQKAREQPAREFQARTLKESEAACRETIERLLSRNA